MSVDVFDQTWATAVGASLGLIVVLAMILERALSVVFEWGVWDVWLAKTRLRAPITFLTAYVICSSLKFDILLVIAKKDPVTFSIFGVGTFLTAATIAGGSKGAITLFQEVLRFSKGGNPAAVKKASAKGTSQ